MMHKQTLHYRRLHRMEYCSRWVWGDISAIWCFFTHTADYRSWWHLSTLASVADPRLFDPRVSDDNTRITTMGMQQTSVLVELPNATGQTGKTEPGDLFHLRQGLLLDHSGTEGVSSRITFESSGLLKQE